MSEQYKLPDGKVLVLRTCAEDQSSYGGYLWPQSGLAACDDWDPTPTCGHGLHGLLWGEGDGTLLSWSPGAKWLVVEVNAADVVAIDSAKVKFSAGVVVYCGTRYEATRLVAAHAPAGTKIVGLIASVPDHAQHEGADRATVSGGYGATVSGGECGLIAVKWWDDQAHRYRLAVGYIGEDGIEANTKYRVEGRGKLVKVED